MGIICCNVECGVCDKCYVEKTEKSLHKRFDGQEDLITDFQALHIMDLVTLDEATTYGMLYNGTKCWGLK